MSNLIPIEFLTVYSRVLPSVYNTHTLFQKNMISICSSLQGVNNGTMMHFTLLFRVIFHVLFTCHLLSACKVFKLIVIKKSVVSTLSKWSKLIVLYKY